MANFYGSYLLVLHTHLPWVMYHESLEEEWLHEAAAETYIPLLDVMSRLVNEGIRPGITFTMSPVLVEQLKLDHFKEHFITYCREKVMAAERDAKEFESRGELHLKYLAERWAGFYAETERRFVEVHKKDIIESFRKLQDAGQIEIMTCGATHAYFPACAEDTSIQAQVAIASHAHNIHFGRKPNGIWLPECGYRPACKWGPPVGRHKGEIPYSRKGVEEFLGEAGIKYFVVDNHQLMKAYPYNFLKDPFFAYNAKGAQQAGNDVAVLARDVPLSLQVWRHEIGYPGDGVYLDFHKRHSEGRHRYWKITHNKADMAYKEYYHPDDAFNRKLLEHAGHYKSLIASSLKTHFEQTGTAAMAMTAYDTELYGHWWFEGPEFIYHLIKWVNSDPEIRSETCSEYLERMPTRGDVYLPESSWGANYDSSTWINEEVAWVLDREYEAEREIRYLCRDFWTNADAELRKIIQQACREFLVLTASDWKFMITNWSTRDHAERRVGQHFSDFKRLCQMARDYGEGRTVPENEWIFLGDCMARNRLFPDFDASCFGDLKVPPVA